MVELNKEMLAVADVYAEALLDLAGEQGVQAEVAEQFADLVRFMGEHRDFGTFMTSAAIDDDPRARSIERLFRGRMHDLLVNLLLVLNRRRRMELITGVERCVQLRMEALREQQEVVVRSAVPLWHEIRTAIRSIVGGWIRKTPILIEEVDPDLIGGLVLRFGDMRVDASVAYRLGQLRRRLRERITHEVHDGARYLVEGAG